MRELLISLFAITILVGCSKEEVKTEAKTEVVKTEAAKEGDKQKDFNPEEFLKEAEEHSFEWYVAETAKLSPEEIAELEEYQAEQEAADQEALQTMLQGAETKESTNDEGQKVIEYKMVNTLGHDVEFFQLQWVEGGNENVSEPSGKVKDGEEFTLMVDPAFDKSLEDIDLTTLSLTGS